MFRNRKKFKRLEKFKAPDEHLKATLCVEDGCVYLNVGSKKISLRSVKGPKLEPLNNDFAVFVLCALSMSNNWAIDVDFPVSEDVVAQSVKIRNAYRLWSVDVLAPLRLNFSSIDINTSASTSSGIICLSGGLDSMSAAIEAVEQGNTKAALLIAGADYKDASKPGFIDLSNRVCNIAKKLGLEFRVVETNVRDAGFHWNMMHSFNLAFCLHAQSGEYGHGAFAQDNNTTQDVFRAPWGNMGALPRFFSTESYTVNTYGRDLDRVGKLKSVIDYDDTLLESLSVCYTDTNIGGNCGKCPKCLQTRAALLALEYPEKGLFVETPNIADMVAKFEVPRRMSGIKGGMVRTAELVDALPDGEIRSAFEVFENRLREEFHRQMPSIG